MTLQAVGSYLSAGGFCREQRGHQIGLGKPIEAKDILCLYILSAIIV